MNDFFDNQRIFGIIWNRRFHFIAIGFIAVVLAVVFSGPAFITPKFKSTARVYPTNLWVLSNESKSEQMLEILNSSDIKYRMFDAFELDQVYKVKKDDPHYVSTMMGIYNDHVSAKKTEFETVEINVLDEEPWRASSMCDSIIRFYNQKVRQMHKAKDWEMVVLIDKVMHKRKTELDSIRQTLDAFRKQYKILDYNNQIEGVTEGYMTALASGRASASDVKKIESIYDNMVNEGSTIAILESRFRNLVGDVDSLRNLHDVHMNEFEKDITYAHVVEYPRPADKKDYPVRWLIVAFTTISAIFLAFLVFLILDYRKR